MKKCNKGKSHGRKFIDMIETDIIKNGIIVISIKILGFV